MAQTIGAILIFVAFAFFVIAGIAVVGIIIWEYVKEKNWEMLAFTVAAMCLVGGICLCAID